MDRLRDLIVRIKRERHAEGNFLGFLNVLVGSRIENDRGELVSPGVSWRSLAALLKRVRWDKQSALEFKLDLTRMPPRDRERFWYQVIAQAGIDSPRGREAGSQFGAKLRELGYRVVGPGKSAEQPPP